MIHQFAAIPSRSHRCCCPPKPETAEHIMHPAQSHPHPPKAFRHHCISTEGNLQTGFRLWHFGSKNSHSAAVLQRGSFGTRACWGVRAITSDLGLQHLGYPLFSLAGCPPLLLGENVSILAAERAEENMAFTATTSIINLQIHLQQWVMLTTPGLVSAAEAGREAEIMLLWLSQPKFNCAK